MTIFFYDQLNEILDTDFYYSSSGILLFSKRFFNEMKEVLADECDFYQCYVTRILLKPMLQDESLACLCSRIISHTKFRKLYTVKRNMELTWKDFMVLILYNFIFCNIRYL